MAELDHDIDQAIAASLSTMVRHTPGYTLSSLTENFEYNDPSAIIYTCETCKKTYTQPEVMHMHATKSLICQCGNEYLQAMRDVMLLIMTKSILVVSELCGTSSVEKNNIDSERTFEQCVQTLQRLYPGTDEECALPLCDGKCKTFVCCKNGHRMHLDCIFSHILKSEYESCPLCRDKRLMLFFHRLLRVDSHKDLIFILSPYNDEFFFANKRNT